jgi:integrase
MAEGYVIIKSTIYESQARKVSLPLWRQLEAFPEKSLRSFDVTLKFEKKKLIYSAQYMEDSYSQMPVVIRGDGSPWTEANLYLISRIEDALEPNMDTISCIATDLVDYCRFLEDHSLEYLFFPRKKSLRVTYRYRRELCRQIDAGFISSSTAGRRISTVVRFYKSLKFQGIVSQVDFKYSPFEEYNRLIQITNSFGGTKLLQVKTTDLSIKRPKQDDPQYISDGEKLKPLSKSEQVLLLEELVSTTNIEMRLICYIALFTGARVQTCCTFRLEHALKLNPSDKANVRIKCGPGTHIDTKYNQKHVLFVPSWLMSLLALYANSDRAKLRREKSGLNNKNSNYLFLSKSGEPYYKSKFDKQVNNDVSSVKKPKAGVDIRQFVAEIRNKIQLKHPGFYFRFHDLRATFGMNMLETLMQLVEKGKKTCTR